MSFIEFLGLLNLVIAFQAIFLLAHFLLKKNGKKIANRLLATSIGAFGVVALNTFLSLADHDLTIAYFQDFSNNIMWFTGPSLYLFARSRKESIGNKQLMPHIFPYIPLALIGTFFQSQVFENWVVFFAFPQMMIYLGLSIHTVIKHYQSDRSFFSWFLPVLVVFAALVIINLSIKVLVAIEVMNFAQDALQGFTVILSVPIFYTSYREMNLGKSKPNNQRYESTPIAEKKAEDILKKIENHLSVNKGFRDKGLTLQLLSDKIDVPAKYISQVINSRLGVSFSDYVNQLRIEEAKSGLRDESNAHLTIAAIAENAGFSSVSRFNHLFKKHTQSTPREFQKGHRGA